jgi:chromosomal replication initiation ATPase DnaA
MTSGITVNPQSYWVAPALVGDLQPIEVEMDIYWQVCSEYFGIPADRFMTKSGKRDICASRQILMWWMRNVRRMKWKVIAGLLERDHATCIHGCNVIENAMDGYEPDLNIHTKNILFRFNQALYQQN